MLSLNQNPPNPLDPKPLAALTLSLRDLCQAAKYAMTVSSASEHLEAELGPCTLNLELNRASGSGFGISGVWGFGFEAPP